MQETSYGQTQMEPHPTKGTSNDTVFKIVPVKEEEEKSKLAIPKKVIRQVGNRCINAITITTTRVVTNGV